MEGEEPMTTADINEDRHQGEDIREADDEQEKLYIQRKNVYLPACCTGIHMMR